jgi:hypothetical protein
LATRSYWLWKISQETGEDVRDVKALHDYIKAKNLVCGELRNNDQLEAIAHYFGVEDARDLPIAIVPKTRKKRVSTFCKSKLTGKQIFDLRNQGVKFEAIAALAGISKQGVSERLRRYKESQL